MTSHGTRIASSHWTRSSLGRTYSCKGLHPARVTLRHALAVALGLAAAWVPPQVGNAILIERVLGIPGMYELVPGALDAGDYPSCSGWS